MGREKPRRSGKPIADQPVQPRPHEQIPRRIAEPLCQSGEEANLLHRRRVTAHQVVAAHAELAHQREIRTLHVLDSAPGEVR